MSKANLNGLISTMKKELCYNEENKQGYKKSSMKFLRKLAKDLGLKESKVSFNPGGIAVEGDPLLMGMWEDGNGIYVTTCKGVCGCNRFSMMYRSIEHMKDFRGGRNQWINCLESTSYEKIVEDLSSLRAKGENCNCA